MVRKTSAGEAKPRKASDEALSAFLHLPGHLIRRSKQKSTAAFAEAFSELDITPIQYAVLHVLEQRPGLPRDELCDLVGLDNATIGGVIARLKTRKLLSYRTEGRRHVVTPTPAASILLAHMAKVMPQVQAALLRPLTTRERAQLVRLLTKLVGIDMSSFRRSRPSLRRRLAQPAAESE